MRINGKHYRSVWVAADRKGIEIFDQTLLPYEVKIVRLGTMEEAAVAIKEMWVRGAPLIGAVSAYGIALAMQQESSDSALQYAYDTLVKTRPTAINLQWALDRVSRQLLEISVTERAERVWDLCHQICEEDIAINRAIGEHGLSVIREIAATKQAGQRVNILTHCNAGWLATVDWGTALAPIYMAHDAGIPVHIWVDETRPRNQGGLTAFELGSHGVPHTLIADNAGGHLMQHGMVDLCLVGTDRTTANGDVCNKIGTYLKALAADVNQVPFYVGLPSPTIDWTVWSGVQEIPIEQREGREQSHIQGVDEQGRRCWVNTVPTGTECANFAFDVTPGRYITGLITERGICQATAAGLRQLFPEYAECSHQLELKRI